MKWKKLFSVEAKDALPMMLKAIDTIDRMIEAEKNHTLYLEDKISKGLKSHQVIGFYNYSKKYTNYLMKRKSEYQSYINKLRSCLNNE